MKFEKTRITGCRLARLHVHKDLRGAFCKTMHAEMYAAEGMSVGYREQFFSVSHAGVIRGMHFQLPPHDHAKTMYCASGKIHDVVLDLRVGSPTYGQHEVFSLDGGEPTILYIPRGCAHGFCALTEGALAFYNVETVYAKEHDAGVRWDSFGHLWPVAKPILSDRDRAFPGLNDFSSPFRWQENEQ